MSQQVLKLAALCALVITTGCRFISADNLNQAIARGEIEVVRTAIARGVDVNARGMHAMTPLMKAAAISLWGQSLVM
jgi:hypothetical protein